MGKEGRKGAAKGARSRRAERADYRKRMLAFLAKFFIIYAFLTALVELADLSFLTRLVASAAAFPFGFKVLGSVVLIDGKTFAVTNACTGLSSAAILAALVFGLKKPSPGKKIAVFLAGLAALLLLNIPRVMLVLFAAESGFDADAMHVFTWFLMSAAILAIWYYGSKRLAGADGLEGFI